MIRKLLLALAFLGLVGPALAQNTLCSDRPTGDSSNACANTRFVGTATGGAAFTKTDDTNVTATLSGSPNTALLRAMGFQLGWNGQLAVGRGGTGIGSGTSGGIPYFNSGSTIASSGVLGANQLVMGGGAGAAPLSIGGLGTTTTVLHGNAAGGPSFLSVVSADLNITTTTCTNQFVTAISAGGVGTCTTDTLASAQHANQGTTTTVLHGNAAGNPAFGPIVSADLTAGTLNTFHQLMFHSGNAANPCLQATTWFFALGQCYVTEASTAIPMSQAGTIDRMFCSALAAPGGAAQTFAMTMRKNAADAPAGTPITCTITTGGAANCSDTTHSFTVASGDTIDVKMINSATSGTAIMSCGVRFTTTSP